MIEPCRTDEELPEPSELEDALARALAGLGERREAHVQRARAEVDAQRREAREEVDRALDAAGVDSACRAAIARARHCEDGARALERALADACDERLREEVREVAAGLLRAEREAAARAVAESHAESRDRVARRDEVLAMVSHDLRTVLNGIALATQVIRRSVERGLSPGALRMAVGSIQDAAGRMNRLIGDLMDVASLDSGKLRIDPSAQDATAVISRVEEAFRGVAESAEIALLTAVPPVPLRACFDADRITQVVGNLVANALKFTRPGGQVLVGVEADGLEVRFFVSDTGCGIALSHQNRVFERFHQVSPGDRRGLGLGLHIARSIVQSHGGRMWLESAPGDGSTFFFTLPALEQTLG